MDETAKTRGLTALSRAQDQGTHTQVPPPPFRWGTRVGVPGAILLGAGVLLLATSWQSLTPAVEVNAVPVVEKAGAFAAAGTEVVQAAGWIEADPYLVKASALTDGVIEEILVLEGDKVTRGQVLARLIDDDAVLAEKMARAELASRESDVASARAHLEAAQTEWDNPVERERAVASAEARLAETRAEHLVAAAQLEAARAEADRLEADLRRVEPLTAAAAASDADLVNARKRRDAQAATVSALENRLQALDAQTRRDEAESKAAREHLRLRTEEREALAAAKASLARAEAEQDRARARLAEARLRLERLEVKAPSDGIIVERLKTPGAKVMAGGDEPDSAVIATLYDPAKLQVRVDVPLADAAKVAVGQKTQVVAEVLPDTSFRGTVTRVLHMADIQKNTLQAKVRIDDPGPMLRPEMLARVKFLAMEQATSEPGARAALHVPANAVAGNRVWVVAGFDGVRGVAEARTVEAAPATGDGWVEIRDGLRPGDLVIAPPPANLKPGARVRATLATP